MADIKSFSYSLHFTDSEVTELYNALWNRSDGDDRFADELIAAAVEGDAEKRDILDAVMNLVCKVYALARANEYKDLAHPYSVEDARQSMYSAYLAQMKTFSRNGVFKVTDHPKKYIISVMMHQRSTDLKNECYVLPAITKNSGIDRDLVGRATSQEGISREAYDALSPEKKDKYLKARNTRAFVSLDQPIKNDDGTTSTRTLGEAVAAEDAADDMGFLEVLDDESLREILDILPSYLMRQVIIKTYIDIPDEEASSMMMTTCHRAGYAACHKEYGLDEDLYKRILRDAKTIIAAHYKIAA